MLLSLGFALSQGWQLLFPAEPAAAAVAPAAVVAVAVVVAVLVAAMGVSVKRDKKGKC